MDTQVFWAQNPQVLYQRSTLTKFIPDKSMSLTEKLNAVTRFLIYFTILFFLISGQSDAFAILLIGLGVIWMLHEYKVDVNISVQNKEETQVQPEAQPAEVPSMDEFVASPPPPIKVDSGPQGTSDRSDIIPNLNFASADSVKDAFTNAPGTNPFQMGGGDCGTCSAPTQRGTCEKGVDIRLDLDQERLCQMPTKNNPFMNVQVTDYANNPNRLPACNPEIVKNDTNNLWSQNLFRNVNDVWDKNNGQMRFNTESSTTIPNDRESFQKWLYDVPYVCKDGDMGACYRGAELQMGQMRHGKIY